MAMHEPNKNVLRLIVLSDTHGHHRLFSAQSLLPPGDILLHCGDFANKGSMRDMRDFVEWISSLSQYQEKWVIDGNHDRTLSSAPSAKADLRRIFAKADPSVTLLQDQTVVSRHGLVLHGSSWKSCEADDYNGIIEAGNVDVWMVHKNPHVMTNYSQNVEDNKGWKGSKRISRIVRDLQIPLVLSGHLHWSRGVKRVQRRSIPITHTYVNAAALWPSRMGVGVSPPVVIDYDVSHKQVLQVDLIPHPL